MWWQKSLFLHERFGDSQTKLRASNGPQKYCSLSRKGKKEQISAQMHCLCFALRRPLTTVENTVGGLCQKSGNSCILCAAASLAVFTTTSNLDKRLDKVFCKKKRPWNSVVNTLFKINPMATQVHTLLRPPKKAKNEKCTSYTFIKISLRQRRGRILISYTSTHHALCIERISICCWYCSLSLYTGHTEDKAELSPHLALKPRLISYSPRPSKDQRSLVNWGTF